MQRKKRKQLPYNVAAKQYFTVFSPVNGEGTALEHIHAKHKSDLEAGGG